MRFQLIEQVVKDAIARTTPMPNQRRERKALRASRNMRGAIRGGKSGGGSMSRFTNNDQEMEGIGSSVEEGGHSEVPNAFSTPQRNQN